MKKKVLFVSLVFGFLLAAAPVFAQNDDDRRMSAADKKDMATGSAEPETFRTPVIFLAATPFRNVIFDLTCAPPNVNPGDLGPGDRCVIIAPVGPTVFNERDLAHVTLPPRSTDSILLTTASHFFEYSMLNAGPTPTVGLFRSRPYMTLESDALNDPRAKDPTTGLPLNGKLDNVGLFALRRFFKTLSPAEDLADFLAFSSTRGFDKTLLSDPVSGFGLPADIADKMFRGPITIRLNVEGRLRNVDFALLTLGLRLRGNLKANTEDHQN